jgi:N-acetyl-gamma-glutamyl-phosphate reductase
MSPPPDAIRVAVVGATGYAGAELVRYLARHPKARLVAVTSEQSAGKPLVDVLPSVRDKVDLRLEAFDPERLATQCEAPSRRYRGDVGNRCRGARRAGLRVVDIGADFRFRDADEYARIYVPHPVPACWRSGVRVDRVLSSALPNARLVANPGCYPTAALLGLLPLAERNLIHADGIVVDAKSGVTGAGRTVSAEYLFAEVDDNLRAYKIASTVTLPRSSSNFDRRSAPIMR